ncbi:MAG: RtcB family protein [Clostridia bacterium]|nr:RtcB family protein [Clostridia bacterium]
MIEIRGKRNSAIVYADKIDKETKTQLSGLLREDAYADSKIRIMPDVHTGRGTVVGTTMTVGKRLSPCIMGVDIGCGMLGVFIEPCEIDYQKLDGIVHDNIPCGSKVHKIPRTDDIELDNLYCGTAIDLERAYVSLGTLGGGNHFIELDKSEKGSYMLLIHSGSRQLGSDVALYYRDKAYRYQCKKARRTVRSSHYSRRGEDEYYTKSARREDRSKLHVKADTALLEGELLEKYIHDIDIVSCFAELNRKIIADTICDRMGFKVIDSFSCVHNYIDTDNMILRKGAISARQGERVIIPLNMRDGVILGVGKGNPDWNFSAPHGAGRICSRTDAKYAYTVEDFQREMQGIYTTTANEGSIDECPMAYKAPATIIEKIKDTVEITDILKPVYNYKSC